MSAPILLALTILAAAAFVPVIRSPEDRHTLIWDPQTNQWKDACVPVRVVPAWMCVPSEYWRTVSWDEALRLLYSGQVDSGGQFHNLTVVLVLKDGTVVRTLEPTIDQIFREIGKCGDPCKSVGFTTE